MADGEVALVTGAAGGIGQAVALRLVKDGYRVVAMDIDAQRLKELAAKGGERLLTRHCDQTQEDQVRAIVTDVERDLGPVEALVNTIGWVGTTRFIDEDTAYWKKVIAINLESVLYVTHAVLKGMVERRRGKMVHFASDAGRIGTSGEVVYSATKGGIIAFAKSLAREHARHNINVNCVSPGPTDTPLLQQEIKDDPELIRRMVRLIPFRRVATPEDQAGAVSFLLSKDADYITGQTISVSGGLVMIEALAATQAGIMDRTDQDQILETVDRLVREHVAPRAAQIDASSEFPRDLYRAAAELGLFGLWIPEEYGGIGPDLITPLRIAERIARVSAAFSLIFSNCGDACTPIVHAAPEHLKREYLPGIAAGDLIPCFALSEPGAGSDAAGIVTAARRDGGSYVINGRKSWCTNGAVGDVYVVFAKTDPDAGSKGISAFIVPRDTPGFTRGRNEELIGLHGSPTTELLFEDVRVPAENRLGEEGQGFEIAMTTLDEARLNCAAMALGAATGALASAVEYAGERVQFGKPIMEHQGLQFLLAESTAELAAARCLWETAMGLLAEGKSPRASAFAAMAKLIATDTAMRITTTAVQAMGGNGLSRSYPVERMMRDVKAFQIFDGTNEIQKLLIGRHLQRSGLPFLS